MNGAAAFPEEQVADNTEDNTQQQENPSLCNVTRQSTD